AILGMATHAGIISVTAFLALAVPTDLAVAIVVLLFSIGTYLSPAYAYMQPNVYLNELEAVSPETHPELYTTVGGKHRADEVEVCEECPAGGCEGCPLVS